VDCEREDHREGNELQPGARKYHFERIKAQTVVANFALVHQSFYEYFRHACAAILAHYGAFLGVGERYGLSELRRMLKLKQSNKVLWSYCRIHNLEDDLHHLGTDVTATLSFINRISALMGYSSSDLKHIEGLRESAELLGSLALDLCADCRHQSNSHRDSS